MNKEEQIFKRKDSAEWKEKYDIQKIKFISDEVAVVHCLTGIKAQWQRVVSKNKINTNVVVKQNGEWKISAFHNTQIKKPGLV